MILSENSNNLREDGSDSESGHVAEEALHECRDKLLQLIKDRKYRDSIEFMKKHL